MFEGILQLVFAVLFPVFVAGFAIGILRFLRVYRRQRKNASLTLLQVLGAKRVFDIQDYTPPQNAMPRQRAESKIASRARSIGMQVIQEFNVDGRHVVAQLADARGRPMFWVEY